MPYRNPNMTKGVVTKYANRFQALFAAMRLGDAFIAAAQGKRKHRPAEVVIGVLFTRAFNNLCASTVLLEEGYPIEASMLTRGLIEDFINICYIAHHNRIPADELAQRFIAYQPVIKYNYFKKARDAGQPVPEERFQEAQEGRKRFTEDYWKPGPYTDRDDWAGLPLWKKSQEAQIELKPTGEPQDKQLREIYDLLNPHFSETVHGGPHAWAQLALEDDHTISYRSGPQDIELYYRTAMPALAFLGSQVVKVAAEVYQLPHVQAQVVQTQRLITELLKEGDSDG